MQTTKKPTFANFKKKALQNKEVEKEYNALKPLFAIKKQLVTTRIAKGLTQDEIAKKIGFPLIIRPAYTLGGTGGSVAYNIEEFKNLAKIGLEASPISEILIEESLLGWKEYSTGQVQKLL